MKPTVARAALTSTWYVSRYILTIKRITYVPFLIPQFYWKYCSRGEQIKDSFEDSSSIFFQTNNKLRDRKQNSDLNENHIKIYNKHLRQHYYKFIKNVRTLESFNFKIQLFYIYGEVLKASQVTILQLQ
jgi:hypothetical protein